MRRIMFMMLCAALCTAGARGMDRQADASIPARHDSDTPRCGGILRSDIPSLAPRHPRAPDDRTVDLGLFVLRMSSAYSLEEFEYVKDVLETVLPSMVAVLGLPVSIDTLSVELDAGNLQYYVCFSNTIVMDGIEPGDGGTDRSWDNVFIHELTHAFQGDILCDAEYPSWLTEGMAEAVRYFASELTVQHTGRDVRSRNFRQRMAVYDMYDNAGDQVLGGCGAIAYRIDFDLLYQNAAGAILVPALAQIAAGLDHPHPLERLTETLRDEMNGGAPHRMFAAIDRAWSAPVDGESPPSRWMRRRAVACPSVRDGDFTALLPPYTPGPVNPPWIRILQFHRSGSIYELEQLPHVFHLRGAGVSPIDLPGEYGYQVLPDLPAGAYLAEAELLEQPYTARSWFIIADPALVTLPIWQGVAVVFIDDEGRPVDIPAEELEVNGRILARVPGAAFVAPFHSNLGNVTIKRNGYVLGTVTATGELPRMALIRVSDNEKEPAVGWTPYHPKRGGGVAVSIDASRTSLVPGPARIDAVLRDPDGIERGRSVMEAEGGDVYRAILPVPADLADGVLSFEAGPSVHESCGIWRASWYSGYEFETSFPDDADVVEVYFDGARLLVRFDTPVDPSRLAIFTASSTSGPWEEIRENPVHTDSLLFEWALDPGSSGGRFARGVLAGSGETGDRILFTEFAEAGFDGLKVTPFEPFPNPTGGVIHWLLDVTAPTSASLQVFDVTGRRVYASELRSLHPGIEVFSWDSSTGSTRAASGVYFLRLRSPGGTFIRKVVVR